MTNISIGENISAVIDEDNHIYTWGTQDVYRKNGMNDLNSKMP